MKAIRIILIFMALASAERAISQGCSDAGICTFHGLKADNEKSKLLNTFRAGVNNGKGDNEINIWSTYFEYYRDLSKEFGAGVRFNYLSESGSSLDNSGFSDIFINIDYSPVPEVDIVAGVKIPLNDANKKFDSLDVGLPMGYQTSLGTFDLLLGIGYTYKGLKLGAGYQQPLNQNKNTYLSTDFPPGAPFGQFQSTNQFERSADLMLRAAYEIPVTKQFFITPGLLPIFHLGNDKYTDSSGAVLEIDGSSGLTLNANLIFEYRINPNNAVVFGGSAPLVTRDSRPDGMGRKYLFNLDYKIMF